MNSKVTRRIKMKFLILALLFVFCGCAIKYNSPADGSLQDTDELIVSAAVSLTDAFDEIGEKFQAKSGKKINFNYGASGALQTQIENGAPVDVFASAGEKQMDSLEERGLINAATRRDFARNSLVLIAAKDSALNVESFSDLTKPEIQKIAVGNPKTVPAGQYAEEALKNSGLLIALQPKIVLAENVRQVLDYVERGETDAGIVYATDALAAKGNVRIAAADDDQSTHSPIKYPLAVIKDSARAQTAKEFTDFVLSAAGQSILRKYGFKGISEQ